jgi:hypothetical protein
MIAVGLLVRMLCDCFKPRPRLEAEILILRHQLNILQQRTRRRPHLRWIDLRDGEKSVSTSPEPQISGLRDQAVEQEARQFGAFATSYGNSPQTVNCVVGLAGLEVRRETGKE